MASVFLVRAAFQRFLLSESEAGRKHEGRDGKVSKSERRDQRERKSLEISLIIGAEAKLMMQAAFLYDDNCLKRTSRSQRKLGRLDLEGNFERGREERTNEVVSPRRSFRGK